ncbi:hypothetical protein B1H26_18320 [Amycolatopsis sp. BJA-103]|nr:hypothetical protein B1H26_18320 [Amycolatopsis sp. BJA-103]
MDGRLNFAVLRGEPSDQGEDQLLEVFVGGRKVGRIFRYGNSTCSGDDTETAHGDRRMRKLVEVIRHTNRPMCDRLKWSLPACVAGLVSITTC